MNSELFKAHKYKIKYWVRRMLMKGGKNTSAASALGVDPSTVTRWASDEYDDLPGYPQLFELARWSHEPGLFVEAFRELGIFQQVVAVYTDHLVAKAAHEGRYRADAPQMLAEAGVDLQAELKAVGLTEEAVGE